MLQFAKVTCDEGVSPAPRQIGPGIALDCSDNLYVITNSGVCSIRKKTPTFLQQYIREDEEKIRDGRLKDQAYTGYAIDLAWDSELTAHDAFSDPLKELIDEEEVLEYGGLWVVDLAAHALRLAIDWRLITVVGGLKRLSRDGLARIAPNVEDDGAFACLHSPVHVLRLKHSSKVLIVEFHGSNFDSFIRILDMKDWTVTTLVTNPHPLPTVIRCFNHIDLLKRHDSKISQWLDLIAENKCALFSTGEDQFFVLNVETGETTLDYVFPRLDILRPIVSKLPLFIAPFNGAGVEAIFLTADRRQILTLESFADYAYMESCSTLVHFGRESISTSSGVIFHQFEDGVLSSQPVHRLPASDYSSLIDSEILPGDLLLTHEDSGKTWLVHHHLIRSIWRYPDVEKLKLAVQNSKLPMDVLDAFVRLLHRQDVFQGLKKSATLSLALDLLFIGRECEIPLHTLLPDFDGLLEEVAHSELCLRFINTWNNPATPWSIQDFVMISLGFYVSHHCMNSFKLLHESRSTESSRDHAELLEFVTECGNITQPLQSDLAYKSSYGFLADQVWWFPLRPASYSTHQWVCSIEDVFELQASKSSENSSSNPELRTALSPMTLIVLTSEPVATPIHTVVAYCRWHWFQRLMSVKWCEEARTRLIRLPAWVTPNLCKAILESVVSELQVRLTPEEVCTLLEFGDELELFDQDGNALPPFGPLYKYCVKSLEHVCRKADQQAKE